MRLALADYHAAQLPADVAPDHARSLRAGEIGVHESERDTRARVRLLQEIWESGEEEG